MKELKENIEKIAAEQGKSPLQVISELQKGAVAVKNDELLEALCEVKWDYIEI